MIWYPYQQMKKMDPPYKIVDAQGVYLHTEDQTLIDSVSSWWCMIHGYKHPELTAAIQAQAGKFCHVMLGGLTHQPVEDLSNKLAEFLPGDLDYCFFSDSGSVGVEVALKMAVQYYVNLGTPRPMVLALEHAYHGDTFRAMEVGDDEDYHLAFPNKRDVVHIPTEISALEEAFAQYHDQLNCVLVEPLLQGAGGMRMYDISLLKRARELCDQYGVLLIFDEVATGFGRTGAPFAWQQAELSPDLVCLSKAINNGYLPLGVLVFSQSCADLFAEQGASLEHFSTQGGNGVAVAAAMGMLDCMKEYDQFHVKEKGQLLLNRLREGLEGRASVRGLGLMAAVDFPKRFDSLQMLQVVELFKKRGILVYIYNNEPVNKGISFFPSFLITEEELERCVQKILSILRRLL